MRKGCRASKYEKACKYYSYALARCKFGRVKATCPRIQQPKPNTKAGRDVVEAREFYGTSF